MIKPEITQIIIDSIPYIDAVNLRIGRPLKKHQLDELQSCCGKRPTCRWQPMEYRPADYKYLLRLLQPTPDAFTYLIDSLRGTYRINYVEPALDFITANNLHSDIVKDYLVNHMIKRWHGNQRVAHDHTTTYFGKRNTANNLVCYSSKPSKTNREPCCHLEWRLKGYQTVRGEGIHNLIALREFDYRRFWERHLQLRRPNVEAIGKKLMDIQCQKKGIVGTHSRRKKPLIEEDFRRRPFDVYRRCGNLIVRAYAQTNTGTSVQELIDNSWFDVSTCLEILPNNTFLPPGTNNIY